MRTPVRLRPILIAISVAQLLGCGAATQAASPPSTYHARQFPPLQAGADTVALLAGGSPAFDTIGRLLAQARSSIHLEMYELQRQDLLDALVAARARGVVVTVVDDPTGAGTASAAAWLRGRGIDVVDYPVRDRMIDHVKLLVVDSASAVVGGINWSDAATRHHDYDLFLHGPVVQNLEHVFDADLVVAGRQDTIAPPAADAALAVLATLPAVDIRPVVLRFIDAAQHTVTVQLFVLTDRSVVASLIRAERRGVQVEVLLDPTQHPSDGAAATLKAAGVAVRRYRSHGELLHAKAMVVDASAVVLGSANWSTSGFEHNHEVDVAVWNQRALAGELTSVMQDDWVDSA